MRKITKIRRTVRAISPVISVLLMIAIAVAASLVAYAWVSGYMDFTTTKVGKSIQIQSISPTAVYVQNVGDSDVTLESLYVNGTLAADAVFDPADLGHAETSTVTTAGLSWEGAKRVTLKVVTTDGISAEMTKTFTSGSTGSPSEPMVIFVLGTGGAFITPTEGTHTYSVGENVAISTAPATDYVFNEWVATGSIVIADEGNPSTTATINGAGSITATFTYSPVTYDVTFILGTGGATINPTGTQSYTYGQNVAIFATPDTDYEFNEWVATGSIVIANEGNPSTTATINGAGSITATFTFSPVTYAVDFILGTGGLSLFPGDGSYTGDIAISATPNTGYAFDQWETTGSITILSPTSASTTATINGPGSITATFALADYSVTFGMGTGGASIIPAAGTYTYNYGDVETISATAATGYTFSQWVTTGDVVVTSPSSPSTTVTVHGTGSVTATFVLIDYSVTFGMGTGGASITPAAGTYTYNYGDVETISATAATGYTFSQWVTTGDVVVTSPSSPDTEVTINGAGSVTATFVMGEPNFHTTVSPTSVLTGGYTQLFTYTITLDDTSNHVGIGYATIEVPAGFSISFMGAYAHDEKYNWWTTSVVGNTITIHANDYGADLDRADNNDYVTVTFSATAPLSTGNYQFVTACYQNIDGTGYGPGVNTGTEPSVAVYTLNFVNTNNDNHSPTNLGSHDNFNNEKAGPDHSYGTLRETNSGIRRLDQEVQFTGVTNFAAVTELQIYTSSLDSEDIQVWYWDGSTWVQLVSDLSSYSLNSISVTLTSSTFELRFTDGYQSSDSQQGSWNIDYIALATI